MPSSRLAERLGLEYPIFQAPIGSMAGVHLASSVSNSGGLGSLAFTWTEPGRAAELTHQLKALSSRPFFVNFVLAFPPKALPAALDAGVPIVTFSWGLPGQLVDRVHDSGAIVGVQVATKAGARAAVDEGADFIICQGIEAGGHVQSSSPLLSLLPTVVEAVAPTPVVATGGIATGRDIASALGAGADAVMLGTRFVATSESLAHPLYKRALVEAAAEEAVLTTCFDGGWPGALHRVLRNSTLREWESAGCPPHDRRPNEGQIIATSTSGKAVTRYDDTPPASDMEGEITACCLYSGLGCTSITDIPNASDLIARLWSEYIAGVPNAA